MNKNRRKRLQEIKDTLLDLITDMEKIRDEEQEAYENMPESVQSGEKGEKMDAAIENMDAACSSLEEVGDYIEEAMG